MADKEVANGHPPEEAKPQTDAKANGSASAPNGRANQTQAKSGAQKPAPKKKRKGRSYAQIHSKSLPLEIHPLPAFQPAHPLSLLRLCYIYLSQLISPPSSHPSLPYLGYFSSETRSIHVTDPAHVRALWEMGFFGKASLSRSEPSWLDREKARLSAERRGGSGGGTAEEATKARRDERRLFKLERARVERERIERQRAVEEGRMSVEEAAELEAADDEGKGGGEAVAEASMNGVDAREQTPGKLQGAQPSSETFGRVPDAETLDPATATREKPVLPNGTTSEPPANNPEPPAIHEADDELHEDESDIKNQEHLQLTLEEAFFLSYALGVLHIVLPNVKIAAAAATRKNSRSIELLSLFAAHATFTSKTGTTPPPIPALNIPKPSIAVNSQILHARAVSHAITAAPIIKDPTESALSVPIDAPPSILSPSYIPSTPPTPPTSTQLLAAVEPDNQFLLNYVVYHHFRSLGWVVRPGVKFAVDYLLYNRGPVFSHAEFGVLILPSYTHEYWATSKGKHERRVKGEKDWWWLHCVNRVQSQVRKTLVLCYVDVPPPINHQTAGGGGEASVAALLRRYRVREFVVRRWLANRSRD